MHEKYAADGLVVVTVNLNDPADAATRQRSLDFLAAQKAAMRNVQLNESEEFWQAKLNAGGPPVVYVFNRDNQFVLKLTDLDEESVAKFDKAVAEELKRR